VATRFQADKDLVVVSGAQGSILDPSTDHGLSAKMGWTRPGRLNSRTQLRQDAYPGADKVDFSRDLDPAAWPDWRCARGLTLLG